MNKDYVRDYLTKHLEQEIKADALVIEPFDVQTGDGNHKNFYQVKISGCDQTFLVKQYPESDVSIGMSHDEQYRELKFVNSELYQEMKQYIHIPLVAAYENVETNERFILMEDVSNELKQFGPPEIPTKDTLMRLLHQVGTIHALTWNDHQLVENHDWLMQFKDFVLGGFELLQATVDKQSQKTWVKDYIDANPNYLSSFQTFYDWLEADEEMKLKEVIQNPSKVLNELNDGCQAICHNDLYFGNVGLQEDKLVLIDWEFVGLAPTAWDVYNVYAGIPCPDLDDNEAFNAYFNGLEEKGIELDKDAWRNDYQHMNKISTIFELRVLIPKVFANLSKMPEERKKMIENHIKGMVQSIIAS